MHTIDNLANDTTVFCLTPVRDEAWILERFLACAATWADHIIIADQNSTDGSREIAVRHPKVILLDNNTEGWSEVVRQNMLINAARAVPVSGTRLLVALDADECLTANWQGSDEWSRVLQASPGTRLCFEWVNVRPDFQTGWIPADEKWFGVMDDGRPHEPELIHGPRLPMAPNAPAIHLKDVKVLHYQYTDWQRMRSKHRWYQAWERIHFPDKRPVNLYRQYHHMHGRDDDIALDPAWFARYEEKGIEMRTVKPQSFYRWDEEVIEFIRLHGTETFRKIPIWDDDWLSRAREQGLLAGTECEDPRSWSERAVHRWLAWTQPASMSLPVRVVQRMLKPLGW